MIVGDNRLDMRQKRHSSVFNHSKVFDLINHFERRPINRINLLNGPYVAAEGYQFELVRISYQK
jgi:hypothetical protein